MKKTIFLLAAMAFGSASAQVHDMPMPEKKKESKKQKKTETPTTSHAGHHPGSDSQNGPLPLSRIIALKAVKPTGKTMVYDLFVKDTVVNFTGKKANAIAINDGITGPTLWFTEGDTAVIRFHNQLKIPTSFHWHGILVPNRQDGVTYLNTPPILAGESYVFQFPIVQSGTYWYHAHSLQEQIGMHGAIVIQPQIPVIQADKDIVIMVTDWTDEAPTSVLRNLKRGNEWYAIRKNNVQSLDKILANKALGAYLKQSLQRMPPMDISDIAYDKFFINGLETSSLEDLKPGEKVRVRVINAGASTFFHVNYAGGEMQVVAADGVDVQPVQVNHGLLGMGETYDFVLTIPDEMAYEFRATAQDGSGYASYYLGKGMKMEAPAIPKPNLFEMTSAMASMGSMEHDMGSRDSIEHIKMGHDMGAMDMGLGEYNQPNYGILKATKPSVFPNERPVREIRLELTGDMRRYIWGINGKPMSQEDEIAIERGEIVRFILVNTTMMFHPMHLHGHFFRVLNGQGEYAPLKHTVSLAPMETVTIEFLADDEKGWMFHCHLLYHMAAGMARVVSYEGDMPDADLAPMHHLFMASMNDNAFFFWGEAHLGVSNNYLHLNSSNNKNAFIFEGDANWKGDFEFDLDYERYLTQYFRVFGGIDAGNELFLRKPSGGSDGDNDADSKIIRPVIGIRYLLPFLIESEAKLDSKGNIRFQLSGEQRLTRRLGLDFEAQWLLRGYTRLNLGLNYVLSRNFSLFANYDTRYKNMNGGLSIRF